MNEIAHKYKDKLTVVGIDVREGDHDSDKISEQLQKRVAEFVSSQGSKMDYPICMDTADAMVFKAWMTASGLKGIPTVAIVDQQGKIAWIGHPIVLPGQAQPFDTMIDELLAEKFDYSKAAASFESDAAMTMGNAATRPIRQALAAKDYDGVLAKIDEYLRANPRGEKYVVVPRVLALVHKDKDDAKALQLAKTATGVALLQLVIGLTNEDNLSKPMCEFAVTTMNQIAGSGPDGWRFLGLLAKAYYRAGDVKKAVEVQQKALEQAKAHQFPQSALDQMQKDLETYTRK